MAVSNMASHRASRRCCHMPSEVQLGRGRLRARTPSGGSGPLRRACAPFAAKAAQGWRSPLRRRRQGLSPYMGGRAFGPPLCGGTPPATPPTKTRPAALSWTIGTVEPSHQCSNTSAAPAHYLLPSRFSNRARKSAKDPFRAPLVIQPVGAPLVGALPRGLDSVDETSTLFLWPCIG